MLNIGSEAQHGQPFELVIQMKDANGAPTGRKKSFTADTPEKLAEIWNRNNGIQRKRRRKVEAAEKHEVDGLIKQTNAYVEKIRKQKGLED